MAGAPHPAAAGDPAEQWYSKAADGGDADAMFNLGALLAEQGGRPGRAVVWTRPSTPDVVMDDRLVCLALHLISLSYTWSESVARDGRYGVHAATRAGNRHRAKAQQDLHHDGHLFTGRRSEHSGSTGRFAQPPTPRVPRESE